MSTTTGPDGQIRPRSTHANAVKVAKILTGEAQEEYMVTGILEFPSMPESLPEDMRRRLIALQQHFSKIGKQAIRDYIASLTPAEKEALIAEMQERSKESPYSFPQT